MAVYTFDLRGIIGDQRPEETLSDQWKAQLPKTDRFGVHTILEYEFLRSPLTQAVVAGDSIVGIVGAPKSEAWELFSIELLFSADAIVSCSRVVVSIGTPSVARWQATSDIWVVGAHADLPITRPRAFVTNEFTSYDEASGTFPDGGLRKRILYPQSALKASLEFNGSATVNLWFMSLDLVRYPSNERLFAMLESGEVTEREMFAALALRFPSPAEAF